MEKGKGKWISMNLHPKERECQQWFPAQTILPNTKDSANHSLDLHFTLDIEQLKWNSKQTANNFGHHEEVDSWPWGWDDL